MRTLLRTAVLALLLAPAASATIRYVDVNLASGANDGSSWANAYQGAGGLTVALANSVAGDQIWVTAGTYKPTTGASRGISIALRTGVEVYGGFLGGEALLTDRDHVSNVTILSGDLGNNDGSNIFTDNSFHVVNGNGSNATAVLDGFTVEGGNANTSGGNQDRGGGFLLIGTSPTIRNCIVRNNRCTFGGGAGYINTASPTFENVRFESNLGGSFGGAFDMASASNVAFRRCVFRGNSAARAGALEMFQTSNVTITNCLFFENTSTGTGGGGAVWIGSSSTATMRFCTVVGNSSTTNATAGILASGATINVGNSIVYFNSGPGGAQNLANNISGSTPTFSCVQGIVSGTGNISTNPNIPGIGVDDYQLGSGSPCIDAGSNALVPASTPVDLAGAPRVVDDPSTADTGSGTPPLCDMGAYELQPPPAVITPFCFGDGSSIPCPCANDGAAGNGCANSAFAVGANLVALGTPSVSGDTLSLGANNLTGAVAIFFQGATSFAPAVVDDGLGCIGGPIVRLGNNPVGGNAAVYPDAGDPLVSVRGAIPPAGATRFYQCFYRNAAAAFCPPATSNRTNGVQIDWQP